MFPAPSILTGAALISPTTHHPTLNGGHHEHLQSQQTPGAINRPFVPAAQVSGPPRPLKPHEACRDCGKHFDACLCDGGPTIRAVMPTPDVSAQVLNLRRNVVPFRSKPEPEETP